MAELNEKRRFLVYENHVYNSLFSRLAYSENWQLSYNQLDTHVGLALHDAVAVCW